LKTPLYQFNRDETYYKKITTNFNKIKYFVGDNFIESYKTVDDISKVILINLIKLKD
jgi:hypothetical protein